MGLSSPPAAMLLDSSKAQLSLCTLQGGHAAVTGYSAGPGLIVQGSSDVELVGCVVVGGDVPSSGRPPQVGLLNSSPSPVRHHRTAFVGGWGNLFVNVGNWRIRGAGVSGLEQATSLLGMVALQTGLRTGQPYGVAAVTTSGATVFFGVTFALASPTVFPNVSGLARFDPASMLFVSIGVAAGNGSVSTPAIAVPAVALGTSAWFHGIAFDGSSFLSGPPVGGLVR